MPETNNATSVSTPAETSTSYVQSLIEPGIDSFDAPETPTAAPQPETTAAPENAPGTEETAAAAAEPKEAPADLEALIQKYATETGLDPNDPNQRKTLKRLADKQLFIQRLQTQLADSAKGTKPGEAQQAEPELLTAFEKSLVEPPPAATEPPVAPEQKPAETPASTEPPKYGDIGDNWKTPEDAFQAEREAWSEDDLGKVHQVELARLVRNYDAFIRPAVEQYIADQLKPYQELLQSVGPEVKRTITDRQIHENREFAIEELRKAGASDIDGLFEAVDGPPIKYGDQEYPNTPLNQLLVKYPEILDVTATHKDPAIAQKQTFIKRFKLAYQMWRAQQSGIAPAAAKQIMSAGAEMKEREKADRARQTMNAGPGVSGVGSNAAQKSYVKDLVNLPGEIPFGSLF